MAYYSRVSVTTHYESTSDVDLMNCSFIVFCISTVARFAPFYLVYSIGITILKSSREFCWLYSILLFLVKAFLSALKV